MKTFAVALLALGLAACGTPVNSGAPPEDVPAEPGTCAAIKGGGCACGASVGAWRCVGEMPVCVCPTVDAGGDVVASDTATDVLATDVALDRVTADAPAEAAVDVADVPACDADVPSMGDPSNCGPCGVSCPTPPNTAGATCLFGRCGFSVCAAGFADCDGNAANGCETETGRDPRNCGMCGNACRTGTPFCVAASCTYCQVGFTRCAGGCVNPLTDTNNCGACGIVCNRCCAGRCAVIFTDTNNCGACGHVCSAGMRCDTGVCVPL